MPDRSPAFRHADVLLKEQGGIVAFVNSRRALAGRQGSWRRIALELRDLTDREVDLDQSTLRSWSEFGWFDPTPDDEPAAKTG